MKILVLVIPLLFSSYVFGTQKYVRAGDNEWYRCYHSPITLTHSFLSRELERKTTESEMLTSNPLFDLKISNTGKPNIANNPYGETLLLETIERKSNIEFYSSGVSELGLEKFNLSNESVEVDLQDSKCIGTGENCQADTRNLLFGSKQVNLSGESISIDFVSTIAWGPPYLKRLKGAGIENLRDIKMTFRLKRKNKILGDSIAQLDLYCIDVNRRESYEQFWINGGKEIQ